MQPNSFFLLLGDHSCCWGSSARWVRCLSSASVWSFFMDHSYFPPGKGRIICIVWIIHTLILQTFLLCPARACAQTHTHTHTLPFAVMNYVHTVYSLINWRCRLRQKRLHKAIPLLFFLLQFIHCTWKWTAAAQLPPSPQLLTLWLACDKTPLVEKVLWTRRQGEQPEAYFLVCVLCKKKVQ